MEQQKRARLPVGKVQQGAEGAGAVVVFVSLVEWLTALLPEAAQPPELVQLAVAALLGGLAQACLSALRDRGWLGARAATAAVAVVALLGLGCATRAAGYGMDFASAWGDASVGCTYDDEGNLLGGSDCVAGGHLSPQAAEVLKAKIDEGDASSSPGPSVPVSGEMPAEGQSGPSESENGGSGEGSGMIPGADPGEDASGPLPPLPPGSEWCVEGDDCPEDELPPK